MKEGSAKERAIDRREARKHKMKMRDWEDSPQDMAQDRSDKVTYKSGGKVRGGGVAIRGMKTKVC